MITKCPNCQEELKTCEAFIGQEIECSTCNKMFVVTIPNQTPKMSLIIKCLKCKETFRAKENMFGQIINCPHCNERLKIAEKQSTIKPRKENNLNKTNQEDKAYTSDLRINKQLDDLGIIDTWFTKKEIKYLPEVIRNDEVIKGIGSGFLDGNTWLIVITNQRLLFLDKGMIYGLKQMEMDYGQISAVSYSTGLMFASITVSTSSGAKKIDNITKEDAPKLSQLISDIIKQNKQQNIPNTRDDIPAQIEKIAKLYEKGILTKEEFEQKKIELLNKM